MIYPEGQKGKKVVPLGNNFSRARLRQVMAVVLLPYLEQEAAARQAATLKQNATKTPVSQKVDSRTERNEGKAAAVAAATVGTNRQYVADGRNVSQGATCDGNGDAISGTQQTRQKKVCRFARLFRNAPQSSAICSPPLPFSR
jgi:hypothetical protein